MYYHASNAPTHSHSMRYIRCACVYHFILYFCEYCILILKMYRHNFKFLSIYSFISFFHSVCVYTCVRVTLSLPPKYIHTTYDDPPKHMCTHVYISINIALCSFHFYFQTRKRTTKKTTKMVQCGPCLPWPLLPTNNLTW